MATWRISDIKQDLPTLNRALNDLQRQIDTNKTSTTTTSGSGIGTITGATGISLQHDGIPNVVQTKLNLRHGTSVTLTDDGVGGIIIGGPTPVAITSIASGLGGGGTLAIVVTTTSHGLVVGEPIVVSGVTCATGYNGNWNVNAVVDATHFNYLIPAALASCGAGGFVTAGTGGGSAITLKTNGTLNASQTVLNLQAGTNVTVTDAGGGNITIASSGGGGGSGPGVLVDLITNCSPSGGHNPCSDASEKIKQCVFQLSAGGICNATGFGSTTQTLLVPMTLGTDTVPIELWVDCATRYNVTLANAAQDLITLGPRSKIRGNCMRSIATGGFQLQAASSMRSVINGSFDSGGNSRFFIEGIQISANPTSNIANAMIWMTNATDSTVLRDVTLYSQSTSTPKLLWLTENVGGSSGPVNLDNLSINCSGMAGCVPVAITGITGGLGIGGINFLGGSFTHPGANLPVFNIVSTSANQIQGVKFYGIQIESTAGGEDGIYIENSGGISVYGMDVSNAGSVGTNCIHIVETGGSVQLIHLEGINNGGAWTNTINDAPHSTLYPYAANAMIQSWDFVPTSNFADHSYIHLGLTKFLTSPNAITCDAAHRGMYQYIAGAGGVKDAVQICTKDAANVYAWRALY